jgi:TPR repeat protein
MRKLRVKGMQDAQYNLGVLYYNGQEGVPQDFVKALEYYEQAALQGHVRMRNTC